MGRTITNWLSSSTEKSNETPKPSGQAEAAAAIAAALRADCSPSAEPVEVPLPVSLAPERSTVCARVMHEVISEATCMQLIRITSEVGYEHALVNTGGGRQELVTDVRNSGRCIIDAPDAADALFHSVRHALPRTQVTGAGGQRQHWELVGLNERLRFLKYEPGGYFLAHRDGTFERPMGDPGAGETSFLTLMLYLNSPALGAAAPFAPPTPTRLPADVAVAPLPCSTQAARPPSSTPSTTGSTTRPPTGACSSRRARRRACSRRVERPSTMPSAQPGGLRPACLRGPAEGSGRSCTPRSTA